MSDLVTVHPSGISKRQAIHYMQEYNSKQFRQFDYGKEKNIQMYNAEEPPNYKLELVKISRPIDLYYSDSDYFSSVADVQRLAQAMGMGAVSLHRVLVRQYNHLDFQVAYNVKDVINNCVVSKIQSYEGTSPIDTSACSNLIATSL